jgi:hypothetical protein
LVAKWLEEHPLVGQVESANRLVRPGRFRSDDSPLLPLEHLAGKQIEMSRLAAHLVVIGKAPGVLDAMAVRYWFAREPAAMIWR